MSESIEKLSENQRAYAEHWVKQPQNAIPADGWPREWHIANRWRCINGHVRVGVTRLSGCRECAKSSNRGIATVPVVRTSPQDETGPFDFAAELKKHADSDTVGA